MTNAEEYEKIKETYDLQGGKIIKFGGIKKWLAAGLTTLALAVSNLSGLELGAEATLLDIREYKATAVLNSISDDDMSHCKLSQLMGTLKDVQALNKATGEYEPVDFVLPDDYSAVWVNGEEYDVYEGKDAELDLSEFIDTYIYKDYYDFDKKIGSLPKAIIKTLNYSKRH